MEGKVGIMYELERFIHDMSNSFKQSNLNLYMNSNYATLFSFGINPTTSNIQATALINP